MKSTFDRTVDSGDDGAAAGNGEPPTAPKDADGRAQPPRQPAAAPEVQHGALAQVVDRHNVCATQESFLAGKPIVACGPIKELVGMTLYQAKSASHNVCAAQKSFLVQRCKLFTHHVAQKKDPGHERMSGRVCKSQEPERKPLCMSVSQAKSASPGCGLM